MYSFLSIGKFEEKEDRVPKLEQLNSFAYMCNLNLALTKKDLLKMELLLLESFNWNLCLPTPAHYIDYYLFASVNESDLHNGWPITSMTKVRAFMEKYAHYFLEVSLQGNLIQTLKGREEPCSSKTLVLWARMSSGQLQALENIMCTGNTA